jgi:hypothetical protein
VHAPDLLYRSFYFERFNRITSLILYRLDIRRLSPC